MKKENDTWLIKAPVRIWKRQTCPYFWGSKTCDRAKWNKSEVLSWPARK